ncbi:MAG: enoyl-CoA hydratase/isomerase family protein [Chloroflexi bacterium]|nr:enoyl-CoA hydratase/isomerase family protein [Chloroflexota bacterium]
MEYEDLIFEVDGNVAVITLNRPDKLNALSVAMRRSLQAALKEVADNDDVRAMVLTGAGRGFCSGADVGAQAARIQGGQQPPSRQEVLSPIGILGSLIRTVDKPTIAAVNGVAAGAGFGFTLACDIRIASDKARFSCVFIKRGLVPDTGATYFLPRLVGSALACELAFTGDIIDAAEALRIGLVNRVVPHDDLMQVAKELATRIAKGPPIAMTLAKRAIYRGMEHSLGSQLEYETYAQNICRATEDHKEGVTAFMEKREPVFKGR